MQPITENRYVEGVTCPACETNTLRPDMPRNSYSRYAQHYICSVCGVKEAFDGFFWRENCLARGIKLGPAGQAIQADRS